MPARPKYPVLIGTLVALLALSASLSRASAQDAIAPSRVIAAAQNTAPTQRAAVATRLLPRGTVLTAADIEYRDTTVRGPIDTNVVAPGWVTRRLIGAGEILRMPAVERPALVSANQSVDVEFTDRNVTLTVRGVATRAASLGERIPVRTELGKRVEATVVAPGRVRID